jgi:hypothetical protein
MPVLTHEEILEALEKCPTVKYPEHVLQRLDREYLVLKAQMASGEVKPMTVEEIAAEYGITLDDLEDEDDED